MSQRNDGVHNLLTSLIGRVCTNVEVEPHLQPLDNERFNVRSPVTSPEARLDFKRGVKGKMGTGISLIVDWENGIYSLGLGFSHWEWDEQL